MNVFQAKQVIERLVGEVNGLIPDRIEADLAPPGEFSDMPGWHSYETHVWEIGDQTRQALMAEKVLRKDTELLDK